MMVRFVKIPKNRKIFILGYFQKDFLQLWAVIPLVVVNFWWALRCTSIIWINRLRRIEVKLQLLVKLDQITIVCIFVRAKFRNCELILRHKSLSPLKSDLSTDILKNNWNWLTNTNFLCFYIAETLTKISSVSSTKTRAKSGKEE